MRARLLSLLCQVFRPEPVRASETMDLAALPRVIPRILALAFARRTRVWIALTASIIATLFAIVLPKLLGRAVDQAHLLLATHAGRAENALWLTAGLIILAASLRGLLTMISGFQFEYISQRFGYELRLAYFEKLQRLDFAWHDKVHSGDLITRGMLDLEGMRMFVENGVQRVITLTLLLTIGAGLMVWTDPLMAALALSFVPFVAWRAFRTGFILRLTWTRLQQRMSVLTRTMEENLQGIRVVRAFAAKVFELAKFDQAANEALKMANDRIAIRTGSVSTMTFAFYLAMALVLWVGGHRVISGRMTVGHLTEFLTFMTILQAPVRQIMMVVNTLARAVSSGSRLFEILDLEPAIRDKPDAPDLRVSEGMLRVEHVDFGFDGRQILSDISFELRRGRTLGIIGAPGSGKSVLAQLLPRFYDVTAGRITIDGQDVRDVSLGSLRKAVSLVQQDAFLFDISLADNVAYEEPDADERRIRAATRTAQLHDHIEALPLSYETPAGERGVSLSGGQRQRLSIARGILGEAPILVFDDSTSAIDAHTEHRVRSGLQKLGDSKAVIVIAHRLSSVMHADEILVLEAGRIVERGAHAHLLALEGRYARLFDMQSGVSDKLEERVPA